MEDVSVEMIDLDGNILIYLLIALCESRHSEINLVAILKTLLYDKQINKT